MTMRSLTGFVMLSTSALACGGHFEVGGMDATTAGSASGGSHAAGGAAAGGAASGGSTTGSIGFAGQPMAVAGAPMAVGGSSPVGDGAPASELAVPCVSSGPPAPLEGPFASPGVVWNRLAMMIWGKPAGPPGTLPTKTTYAWASDIVDSGFADATAKMGAPYGTRTFVAKWLTLGIGVGEDPGFLGHYETLLARDVPALEILLQTPLGETGRVGVFSEPKWLGLHPTISSRGAAMAYNLFQQVVPPQPENLPNPPADPSLPDRAALAQALYMAPCVGCHNLMDPPGYALGHFAADSTYRELDHGQPIDATGVITRGGRAVITFDGIDDLGAQLADKCEPTLALADGFLQVALDLAGFSPSQQQTLFMANQDRMRQAYVDGGRSYTALVKAFAQSPAVLRP
jgi:hypothetical protein